MKDPPLESVVPADIYRLRVEDVSPLGLEPDPEE
jgi:hypothetical protein